jgi:hypothetical protein
MEKIGHSFRGRGVRFPAKRIDPDAPPAVWKVADLPAGRYRVLATWFGQRAHCPQAVYRLRRGDKVLVAGTVDQTAGPEGRRFEGVRWQEIGVIEANGGAIEVQVTASPEAEGKVVADGVWLRPVDEEAK